MKHNALIVVTVLVASLAIISLPSRGQQLEPRSGRELPDRRIQIGTSLEATKTILTTAKVPAGGIRSFSAHPSGDKWLFHSLRKGKIDLVIRYSPRMQKITELTLYYVGQPRSKSSDIAVSASAIQFYADGSYAVLFPPATPRSVESNAGKSAPLQP